MIKEDKLRKDYDYICSAEVNYFSYGLKARKVDLIPTRRWKAGESGGKNYFVLFDLEFSKYQNWLFLFKNC